MTQRTLRRLLTLATLTLLSATLALAQPQPHTATPTPPIDLPTGTSDLAHGDWARASSAERPSSKLLVVTIAQPTQRHACRIKAFTPDQLVCKRAFAASRIYKPQEVAALIQPGDRALTIGLFFGFNSALGAATWATVVLAPVCIPCAAATGVAALLFFSAAGAMVYGDDQPETLLYLAPNQTLQTKLH